jgi:tetratricopeptide (TPR) repeat protein
VTWSRRAGSLGFALWAAGAALAAAPPDPAPEPAEAFRRAGEAYEAGRLAEALRLYESAAATGVVSVALYYNLGNVHWRLDRRGWAALWYERARRLAPRDADVRYNLALARSGLDGGDAPAWELLDRVLTPDELAVAVAGLGWALGLGLGWALWRGLPWSRWRRPALAGLAVFALLAGWLVLRDRDLAAPWAVVVVPEAEVRSGPGDQFPVGFTARAGQRALITDRRPGWVSIGVPDKGLKGWVPENAVERI